MAELSFQQQDGIQHTQRESFFFFNAGLKKCRHPPPSLTQRTPSTDIYLILNIPKNSNTVALRIGVCKRKPEEE